MSQVKTRILLVEDDPVLGFVVKDFLQKHHYEVVHCTDSDMAWQQFMKSIFDLCLLDVMIPGKRDGIDLANNIRRKNEDIPIMMVTSKNMDDDKLAGFDVGADDYITKPYSMQELLRRIQVFLKRSKKKDDAAGDVFFKIGEFEFDYANLTLTSTRINHQLTQREADLLKFFCNNPNRIVKRDEILMEVWGKDDYFLGRSMDVFVTKIRKYLKDQEDAKLYTIHGIGFKFMYENPDAPAKSAPEKQS